MNIRVSFFMVAIMAILSSFTFIDTGYQQVLANCKKKEVKSRLIEFQKGGIEVKTFEYDIEKVIAFAETFKGTPHKMGGLDKKGIDCSGLMFSSHSKFGVQLPRTSQEQARMGKIVPTFDLLQRGDLVFYYNSYKTSNFITHTGIYLGHGKFIHTSNSKGVIISDVDDNTIGENDFCSVHV